MSIARIRRGVARALVAAQILVLLASAVGPVASVLAAGNSGLRFDGTNDHVTFGDPSALKLATFTIETWFRRDGPGATTGTGSGGVTAAVPLLTKGRSENDGSNVDMNYFLGIDGATGLLVADFEEGASGTAPGQNHPVSGTTVIQNATWYHAAATYDGTTWRLYLNGALERTLVVGQPVRADSTQDAGLGTALNSSGTPAGAFNGVLDEARIWNSARSEAQIQAAMTGPVTSSPGLVARWSMDEGAGSTIASSAGTTINGTLTNGPLWVEGTPFVSTANLAPNVPSLVAPSNGATGVATFPTLQATVSDPNGGSLTTSFYGRTAGPPAAEDFTIVLLPDTQHYTDSATREATYRQQTQWIVDNADDLNVVFVSHLGDLTENFDTIEVEWQRADAAMAILDAAGIPNNVAPGNHDLGVGGTTSRYFDQYFPPSRYNLPANPWYGGWLGEEAGQVQRLNKDNYELFSAGGIDFLIVHLEIDMPTYATQWANEIIDRYPDRQVIVSTHAFLDLSSARPSSRVTARSDGQIGSHRVVEPDLPQLQRLHGGQRALPRRGSTHVQQRLRGARPPGPDRLPGSRQRRRRVVALLHLPAVRGQDRRVHVLATARQLRDRREQPVLTRLSDERPGRLRAPRDGRHALRLHGLDGVAGTRPEQRLRVVCRHDRRRRQSDQPDLDLHDRVRIQQQPAGRHEPRTADRARGHGRRPADRGDRSGRRSARVQRNGPARGAVDQCHHRAHHRHGELRSLGREPALPHRHGGRRQRAARPGFVHVDGHEREQRAHLRPGPGGTDQPRGHPGQPRRGRHRPRRRSVDVRRRRTCRPASRSTPRPA